VTGTHDRPYQLDQDTELVQAATQPSSEAIRVFTVEIKPDWRVIVGPNGGYIAAILQKGMSTALHLDHTESDQALYARSLTIQFLNPSVPGPASLTVRCEKKTRRLAQLTARLEQEGVTIALGSAYFGTARMPVDFRDQSMPEVAPPDQVPSEQWMSPDHPWYVPFRAQFEQCTVLGAVHPHQSDRALSGGWIRFKDRRPLDELGITTLSDAWYPSLTTKQLDLSFHCPTLEHTVYFHGAVPDSDSTDFCLMVFEAPFSTDGFVEETGRIWSASGELLATTRQLAALTPWSDNHVKPPAAR
jgi:acyl-CoA thioesterase